MVAGPEPTGSASAEPSGAARALADFIALGPPMVLSGAGLSTESGIPDYRGETGRRRNVTPITYQEFTGNPAARHRYWARAHRGWSTITTAYPNDGHRAVAALQRHGLISGIVTQNVDGLHTAAGAVDVVELHGSLAAIICLDCGRRTPRQRLSDRLSAANVGWAPHVLGHNPDGDVELSADDVAAFVTVDCETCGGMLKPDVVFFGERVPVSRVERSYAMLRSSRSLLVLGSSLAVMSGHRFVLDAAKRDSPIAIVAMGETRGDDYAELKLEVPLGALLSEALLLLGGGDALG